MHNTLPPNAADYFKTPAKTTPEHARLRSQLPAMLIDANRIVAGPAADKYSAEEWKAQIRTIAREILDLAA